MPLRSLPLIPSKEPLFQSLESFYLFYLELFDEAHIVDYLQIYGCSYVEQLSRSLYVEYKHSGIDVQCQVCIVTPQQT
jgi:hypothetical protein